MSAVQSFLSPPIARLVRKGCAGAAGLTILIFSGVARAEEMTFQSVGSGDGAVIAATGQITDRTPKTFAAFLRGIARGKQPPTVYLDSSGGTVAGSMELGTLLRQAGATAVVGKAGSGFFGGASIDKGECYSACVYALMGGRRRVIPPDSEVGIHRMFLAIEGQGGDVTQFASSRELAMASGIRSALMRYTSRMGVSPELITFAERTPPAFFHVLTQAEIQRWRLGVPAL